MPQIVEPVLPDASLVALELELGLCRFRKVGKTHSVGEKIRRPLGIRLKNPLKNRSLVTRLATQVQILS